MASILAGSHDGVVPRAELRRAGIDRWGVASELKAGRWQAHGLQTVAVHTGALSPVALQWRAVWEVGRGAALDGLSALCAAGLVNFGVDAVHVSVPHGTRLRAVDGVRVHRVCRIRPSVAAVATTWR